MNKVSIKAVIYKRLDVQNHYLFVYLNIVQIYEVIKLKH